MQWPPRVRARFGPGDVTSGFFSSRQTRPLALDAGAEFGYYSTDITRTFPIDGRFTARQRAIYDLVLGAEQVAMDSVRPGRTIAELNTIARCVCLRERS